jgi:DNA mismatch repair protein MutS
MQSPISASPIDADTTPMMAQYLEIKRHHEDALLLYRMGDFYELFFADAEKASATLGIALTKRGKHKGLDIPMCGVPVHALDHYLQKLIRHGHKAAIAEQLEDPAEAKKRGAKSVVSRGVIRLITPGTLTEETLLEAGIANYLACIAGHRGTGDMALAYAEISTGQFVVRPTDHARLATDLARLQASEILISDSLLEDSALAQVLESCDATITPLPSSRFDFQSAEHGLKAHFQVEALEVFGAFRKLDISALGALLGYIKLTQVASMPHLRAPTLETLNHGLAIDAATRANLELTRTLAGERKGSLLDCLDETATPAGARLLASFVAQPLNDPTAINARLDGVAHFYDDETLSEDLRAALKATPDLARALGRITAGRGGPRDLAAIANALIAGSEIQKLMRKDASFTPLPNVIAAALDLLNAGPVELAHTIIKALADELPFMARDGGFIAKGYDKAIDEHRNLRDDTRQVIANLQADYAQRTGIKSLKIKHNNILGYFIEVTAQQAEGLKSATAFGEFIHRQTIASATRLSTLALGELEQKIAMAGARVLALELELSRKFCDEIVQHRQQISDVAEALAALDVFSALGRLAKQRRYVRPRVDDSRDFKITSGRHPVVELVLQHGGERPFSPNDSDLSEGANRLWLITGPNMAGKSTYLRQQALIVVMAQMGSFVPATQAHIGVVDKLFSRVGAADDLARGRSTFMVEMIETAAILNQATRHSLVILDEIGRGTATYDGLSIAWATLEHLHDVNQCRALFATHYHELTALSGKLKAMHCATMSVKEWNDDIVFLHEVVAGVAGRSYGIQAARLAGIPPAVIQRASEILKRLESGANSSSAQKLMADLPLFAAPVTPPSPKYDPLRDKLGKLKPDELSPREALDQLYELQRLMRDEKGA